jgi:ribose transport system substrate-binding protein
MTNDLEDEDSVSRRHAMRRMLWVGTGLLGMAAAGSNSFGQGNSRQAAFGASQMKLAIPVIVRDRRSPFWQNVLSGARRAGEELGVNVIEFGTDSEADVSGQIAILAHAVALNPSAIVIAPARFAAVAKAIENAAKSSRIIGIDSDEGSPAFAALLGTNNTQAGQLAADILADSIKRTYADAEGDVAILTSSPGKASIDQRAKSFKEQVASKYGALDIVAHKVDDGRANAGFSMMMELISDYPELRGVFASDLVVARGAAQALAKKRTNQNGDTINFVGFDSDTALVQLLQDGTVAALVVQNPVRMGYDSIKTALAAARGGHVPTNVFTDASLITKANMDSPRSKELLGPKIN